MSMIEALRLGFELTKVKAKRDPEGFGAIERS
jgi:hypothetical protein